MKERVIAFDVRHRDVYADTLTEVGRSPTLEDIYQNILKNYGAAREVWHTRMHRSWGFFRSLWPASLLLDRRLDRTDPETKSWLIVSSILMFGCGLISLLSIHTFL